jgi:hypothetical protein
MNTKSALIIAVAIVIGFSIEPILDRVDFSDPREEAVLLKLHGYTFSPERFIAGNFNWKLQAGGVITGTNPDRDKDDLWIPADQNAADVVARIIHD